MIRDYLTRRGLQDAVSFAIIVAGIWAVMTWAQALAEYASVRWPR